MPPRTPRFLRPEWRLLKGGARWGKRRLDGGGGGSTKDESHRMPEGNEVGGGVGEEWSAVEWGDEIQAGGEDSYLAACRAAAAA